MSPRRRAAVAAWTRSMMTSASGSAATSGQPITSSAQPQSQISASSSASVAASSVTSSAHASSEQTSLAMYIPGMVERPPDGMHESARAVYSEAGGSFSGMPGNGASCSSRSAGGPSGWSGTSGLGSSG